MARWRKGEKLGWGRFGVVFAGKPADGEDVYDYAIKYLQTDLAQVPEVVKRFEREIEILESLDHRHVMPVVAKGHNASGVPFFVMRRASDGSLKDAIEDGRTADEAWSVGVFRDVLGGVAHAHERSVLHRDLKPSNVLISSGVPVISDFGIAKQIDVDGTTLTRTAQELGTLRYMAPEQAADSKRAGPPADVYALGKILGHMLSGREPTPLAVDLTGVPEQFRWFIDKCCRDDPAERFADAGVALARFEQLLTTPAVELPPLERGQQLAEAAGQAIGDADEASAIEALDAHLRTYAGEEQLFRGVVPRIPKPVLRCWAAKEPNSFRALIRAYDNHINVNGALSFDYCDTIADFLQFVFGITKDLAVHRLVIRRLLEVGVSHNRWHVRDVAVELLASLKSPSEVAAAVEVIDDHQRAASWVAELALKRPLRAPIVEALRRASASPEAVGW
ncbi:MAG: serine/threonine-protein kinase [Solirubrobacteraceae bacterium]